MHYQKHNRSVNQSETACAGRHRGRWLLAASTALSMATACGMDPALDTLAAEGGCIGQTAIVTLETTEWVGLPDGSASVRDGMPVTLLSEEDANGYYLVSMPNLETQDEMDTYGGAEYSTWPHDDRQIPASWLSEPTGSCDSGFEVGQNIILPYDAVASAVIEGMPDDETLAAGTILSAESCGSDDAIGCTVSFSHDGEEFADEVLTGSINALGLLRGGYGRRNAHDICPAGWAKMAYAADGDGGTFLENAGEYLLVPRGGAMAIIGREGDRYQVEIPVQANRDLLSSPYTKNDCESDHEVDKEAYAPESFTAWIDEDQAVNALNRCVPWGLAIVRAHGATRVGLDCDINSNPYYEWHGINGVSELRNAAVALANLDGARLDDNPTRALDVCSDPIDCAICGGVRVQTGRGVNSALSLLYDAAGSSGGWYSPSSCDNEPQTSLVLPQAPRGAVIIAGAFLRGPNGERDSYAPYRTFVELWKIE